MNRLLSVTRQVIPYVKELRPYAGSIAACILMQQLDFWFEKYPDGFFKFLEPSPNHQHYRPGQSWVEELGMSKDEFRTAFDNIGVRYKSRGEFEATESPFERDGKEHFYCSYFDRIKGITVYYRNHDHVDQVLDLLISNKPTDPPGKTRKPATIAAFPVSGQSQFTGNGESQFTEIGNPNLQVSRKLATPTYGGRDSQRTEVGEPNLDLYPEINKEIKKDIDDFSLERVEEENQEPVIKQVTGRLFEDKAKYPECRWKEIHDLYKLELSYLWVGPNREDFHPALLAGVKAYKEQIKQASDRGFLNTYIRNCITYGKDADLLDRYREGLELERKQQELAEQKSHAQTAVFESSPIGEREKSLDEWRSILATKMKFPNLRSEARAQALRLGISIAELGA